MPVPALRAAAALLVLLAPACGSSATPPAPWVVVHRGREAVASVDTGRLGFAGDSLQVWIRFDYDAADPLPDDPEGRSFKRVDVHTRLDCDGRGVRDLRMELRDSAGHLLEGGDDPTRWRQWEEHPFSEYVFPKVCRYARARRPG